MTYIRGDRYIIHTHHATQILRCYEALRKNQYGSTLPIARNELADILDSFIYSNIVHLSENLRHYETPAPFYSTYTEITQSRYYDDQGSVTNAIICYRHNPVEFFVDALSLLEDPKWNKGYQLYFLSSMYAKYILKVYDQMQANGNHALRVYASPDIPKCLKRVGLIQFLSQLISSDAPMDDEYLINAVNEVSSENDFKRAIDWAKTHPASVFCYMDPYYRDHEA